MITEFLLTPVCAVTAEDTLPNAALWIKGGQIAGCFAEGELPAETAHLPRIDGKEYFAVPGFIDLHIHGYAGFGPELADPQALLNMSVALLQTGVTAFCPTLYCAKPAEMERLLKKLVPAVGKETGARILGFHLEGPFISPKKPGVMKPQDIAPADLSAFTRLYDAAEGHMAAVTLAPEVPGIEPIVAFANQHAIRLQAGHTHATYDEFLLGAARGVTHVTHLFNAMSPFTHREPGAAGAALMHPGISCEIIADGVHVHPDVVAFLRTVKPVENIVAVTDALLPTGQEKGPFIANGEEVIFDGGVWKRKTDRVIAGSALTMARAFKNLVDYGFTLPQAVQATSANAARLSGLTQQGRLKEGARADIVLLNSRFEPVQVFLNGEQIKNGFTS